MSTGLLCSHRITLTLTPNYKQCQHFLGFYNMENLCDMFTSNCLYVNSFHPVQPSITEHMISKLLHKELA